MKRMLIVTAAAAVAAVPAVFGLVGNASFAQTVPVRVPAQVATQSADDHGGNSTHAEPGDDNGVSSPSAIAEPGDDNGGSSPSASAEPGDDNGGSSTHAEPGDDNGGSSRSASAKPTTTDDHGGSSHDSSSHDSSASASHGGDDGSGHR